jgi:transposase-like protein
VILSDNILTSCIVCGSSYAVVGDPTYAAERWHVGVCGETCAVDYWQKNGIPGSVCTYRNRQTRTSDANVRQHDGHETIPMAARVAVKEKRQAKVAELFGKGLDRKAIAAELAIPAHRVGSDLRALGLTQRTRHLDQTRAFELADSGMSWPQVAAEIGITHSTLCAWMRKAGRKPPAKKSKHHLKPQAFALYDKGTSWAEISSTLGIASATLSSWLRSRGANVALTPAAQGTE